MLTGAVALWDVRSDRSRKVALNMVRAERISLEYEAERIIRLREAAIQIERGLLEFGKAVHAKRGNTEDQS